MRRNTLKQLHLTLNWTDQEDERKGTHGDGRRAQEQAQARTRTRECVGSVLEGEECIGCFLTYRHLFCNPADLASVSDMR